MYGKHLGGTLIAPRSSSYSSLYSNLSAYYKYSNLSAYWKSGLAPGPNSRGHFGTLVFSAVQRGILFSRIYPHNCIHIYELFLPSAAPTNILIGKYLFSLLCLFPFGKVRKGSNMKSNFFEDVDAVSSHPNEFSPGSPQGNHREDTLLLCNQCTVDTLLRIVLCNQCNQCNY